MSKKQINPIHLLIAGFSIAILGAFLLFITANQAVPTEVNQTTIPMSADDFNDDPRLKQFIEKQMHATQPNKPTGNALQPSSGL